MNLDEFEAKVAEGRALAADGARALAERRRLRAEKMAFRSRQKREALAREGEGGFSPCRLLTSGEVRAVFGLTRYQLDKLARDGRLHRITSIGRHCKWRASDVEAFIKSL